MNENITISHVRHCKETNCRPEETTWPVFIEKLRTPEVIEQSIYEFHEMDDKEQKPIKDGAGFVGGYVKGSRTKDNIKYRDVIALDADNVPQGADFIEACKTALSGTTFIIYNTIRHTDHAQRFRLLVLTERISSREQYKLEARQIMNMVGAEYFDDSSDEWERFMYYPKVCKDAKYVFHHNDGAAWQPGSAATVAAKPQINSNPVLPEEFQRDIPEGERDKTFTRLAGLMLNNMPPEAVLEFLLYQNEKYCSPPMDPAQVKKIVKSIGSKEMAKAQAEFTEVKDFKKKALPCFPVNALPPELANYVEKLSTALQVPPDLPASLLLSILATCCAGKVRVQGVPGWIEPTNLFTLVILPPGERKSATLSALRRPVDEFEALETERLAPEIAKQQAEYRALEKVVTKRENTLAKEPNDYGALADLQQAAEKLLNFEVMKAPRLTTSDATPEKVVNLMADNGGRLAILSAEGGLIEIAAGRYSNGMSNFEYLLHGHAGDTIRVDRVGRPADIIKKPALTVGITAQPDVLKVIQKNAQFRGRGLSARFMYSLPRPMVGNRDTHPEPMPENLQRDYENMIYMLLKTLDGDVALMLSPEAAEVSQRFAAWLEPKLKPETGEYSAFADWCAKAHGAALRIAGLLHMADLKDDYKIDAETMEKAFKIILYYTEHAKRALGADEQAEHDSARKAIKIIKAEGVELVTPRLLMKKNRIEWPNAEEALETLETLEAHGYLSAVETKRRGRPSPTFAVNPDYFK
ncbi:DUF3987 domain-containing protein [Anoxynatronum sibiricum]|uniref:DUF3987 domain-containing protein n=1 Tax=Anoxynatronum sibiricum TaxID=210623 RepID=A0ABU9VWF9_9CLOT